MTSLFRSGRLLLCVCVALCLAHGTVAAQGSASVPQAAAVAPPAPAATPIAPAAPALPIRAYGILWAAVYATQPLQTFGLPTTNAPTAAVNRAVFSHPDDGVLSFQVQQTRAGLVVGESTPLRATLEIDFIHFEQSSPVQQAYPRLRVALLEWQASERHKLFMGQTWDIFGNATGPQLLSHSFNLVGTLFQAGNIGFMRQQLGWSGRFGALEMSSALGMQGANTGPIYHNLEQSLTPTGALRVMVHLPGKRGVMGVSGIGTALRLSRGNQVQHRGAGGALLFGDSTFGPLNVHGELYVAQNLANTGALNLGQGHFGKDVIDAGGYLSGKLTLGKHAFTAMYGTAVVLNPEDVAPGYTPHTPTASVMTTRGTANPGAGPGMRYNLTGHLGYWYSPLKGFSLVIEPHVFVTRFKLAPADAGKLSARNTSWGGMLGSMYQF